MTHRILAFLKYTLLFARELWNANITVVKLVLSRELKLKPGFLAVPLNARTDFEITSYANSITLTPGTISVHVTDDRDTIIIHAIDIGDDPQAVRDSCTNALEKPLLRWTRDNPPAEIAAPPSAPPPAAPGEGAKP